MESLSLPPEQKLSPKLPLLIGLAAALFTLIPPYPIGTGTSALVVQSLEHWLLGTPDTFEALHVHWLWIPRVIAFLTGGAFSALVVFRALIFGTSIFLFVLTARRLFDERRAMIAAAMLVLNVTVLYLSHTFGTELITLFASSLLLYLFTSANSMHHRIGAILFGLSLSIGFWPFVLLMAVVTVALNIHHTRYGLRSRETFTFFGLILLGIASYLLLELFYFGYSHLWEAMNPKFFAPHYANRIAEGIIIAIVSANVLLASLFRKKPGGISREFQAAFLILGIFFLANTFSREDMMQDAAILVPCLILVAIDRLEKLNLILPIYLVWNISLFIFLPSFALDPQIALSDSRRTNSTDQIAFSYYKSFDLLSYSELRMQSSREEEVHDLLSKEHLDSSLTMISTATDANFDGGTLAAEFPKNTFALFYGQPLNIIRRNGINDTTLIAPHTTMPPLCGLFDKIFAEQFLDHSLAAGTRIDTSEHFEFIDCRTSDQERRALLDQLLALEYQGFHHH